jgi:hypothetical protein
MLLRIERGHIELQYKDGAVSIQGEGYSPEGKTSGDDYDYSIYTNTIKWDPPYEKRELSSSEKSEIVQLVIAELAKLKMKVETLK